MVKISVITINYNNSTGLKKTIESVIKQTYANIEYITIDVGSTDESIESIKAYENSLTYWFPEPDNGTNHAMNKGIKKANRSSNYHYY